MVDGLDAVELGKLESIVEDLQGFIRDRAEGPIPQASSMLLADAERRIEALEFFGAESVIEREKRETERVLELINDYLVERETALSVSERGQYSSFLSKPFFTKSDFAELNEFYGSAYERLTERGKAEMSFRVWEGVRNGEYLFTDLPDNVKEKESERLYNLLANPDQMPENLKNIPEAERQEFMVAMKSGNREAAYKMLDGESFKDSVASSVEVAMKKDQVRESEAQSAEKSKEREQSKIEPTRPGEFVQSAQQESSAPTLSF